MADVVVGARTMWRVGCVWLIILSCAATATAQLPPTLPNPRFNWLFPAGGRIGTTFEVTVIGDDLDDARELYFDAAGITAKLKMVDPGLGQTGPQPAYGTFVVTIAADVPQGTYDLRVLGKYGLSTPRAFVVGTRPEINETEPNSLPSQAQAVLLGTTINGTCEPSALDYYEFTAKRGQRVIVDCQAFRIDSRLDGTLVLYDSTGKELERSHNINRRDPLIDFTAPADGDYLVSLHDHMYDYYAFAGECFYRLSIHTDPYVDYIFPPAGLAGTDTACTVYGRNLPGGKPSAGMEVAGKTLEMLPVQIPLLKERSRDLVREGGLLVEPSESFVDGVSWRLRSGQGYSNPVLFTAAGAPVITEQEPNDDPAKAPLLKLPCEFVGQFYPRGDRDWVSFAAKKDEVLYLEVFSQRLGLPTDARIVVQQVKQDDKGAAQIVDLQTVDDDLGNSDRVHWSMLDSVLYSTNTHDPSCKFVAPEDGTYRVMVRDLSRPSQDLARSSKGNARHVYRLSIRRPEPDFRLVAVPRPPTNLPADTTVTQTAWSPVLQPGGATLIEVQVMRRDGFDGEIHVTADHLPAGVTAQPIIISPGQPSATLVLKAGDTAPAGISDIFIQGKSLVGKAEFIRPARTAAMIWAIQLTGVNYHRSRLTDRLPVCVVAGEPAPYSVQVEPELKLAASIAGTVKFPVSAVRRGNFQGPLDLFTFGLPPSIYGPMHAQPKYHTPITLAANQAASDFTVTVPMHVPPGTYTFFVSGVGTISYARDPEKLKSQEERLATIEKIVADNDVRLKAATETQAAAAKALAAAQAAQQDVKSLTEAKVAADKALAEIDQKTKQNAAFLQTFKQEVTVQRNKSKPADLKISLPSTRVTMTITPAPFELEVSTNNVAVKAGGKVELPLKIKRLYGFNDPVNIQFQGVHTIQGINSPLLTIPAGQTEGKLVIEAYANTLPKSYSSTLIASAVYNGQLLSVKPELKFTIEPAAQVEKVPVKK